MHRPNTVHIDQFICFCITTNIRSQCKHLRNLHLIIVRDRAFGPSLNRVPGYDHSLTCGLPPNTHSHTKMLIPPPLKGLNSAHTSLKNFDGAWHSLVDVLKALLWLYVVFHEYFHYYILYSIISRFSTVRKSLLLEQGWILLSKTNKNMTRKNCRRIFARLKCYWTSKIISQNNTGTISARQANTQKRNFNFCFYVKNCVASHTANTHIPM